MSNPIKTAFIEETTKRFGCLRKLGSSHSLFEVGNNIARLYFRYSKRHPGNRTFFGLRKVDLHALIGHRGVLCFFWDDQREPLFIPFEQFEEVFSSLTPANDGQYKVQVYERAEATELYIANAGRFNVESCMGWDFLSSIIKPNENIAHVYLSHSQIQTLLGGIGCAKGFDVWIPANNRANLDWSITQPFRQANSLPTSLMSIKNIAEEVDVIWLEREAANPAAFFEVEHSSPIYSGLLRLNDIHLMLPGTSHQYGIVSNDTRRALFVRQLDRPTFKASGLREICTFFEYQNVFGWHERIHMRRKAK